MLIIMLLQYIYTHVSGHHSSLMMDSFFPIITSMMYDFLIILIMSKLIQNRKTSLFVHNGLTIRLDSILVINVHPTLKCNDGKQYYEI